MTTTTERLNEIRDEMGQGDACDRLWAWYDCISHWEELKTDLWDEFPDDDSGEVRADHYQECLDFLRQWPLPKDLVGGEALACRLLNEKLGDLFCTTLTREALDSYAQSGIK